MQGDSKELVRHDSCLHRETSTLGMVQDQIHQVPETEPLAHACIQYTLILQASLGSGMSGLHWTKSPAARKDPLMTRLS